MLRRRSEVVEDVRRADDRCLFRMSERNLDHLDAEERRVGILVRRRLGATGELAWRAYTCGARDVDVDVVLVFRIDQQRMGV